MALNEEARKLDSAAPDLEYLAIEARIAAAEKQDEAIALKKYGSKWESATPSDSLENKLDKNHRQIIDALHRIEFEMKSQLLDRLARVESKLQHVA
jgi:hypothetical protein